MKQVLRMAALSLMMLAGFAFALDIVMDADRDAFYNTLSGPEEGYLFIPSIAVGTGTQPDDDADCSALVWFAWDADYLYCYAEVWDDLVQVNNSTTYENDAIELKMDPDPLMQTTSGVAAVRLSALGEDDAEVPAGVDNLVKGNELDEAWEPVEGEDYARKLVETDPNRFGYNLEFRLPFNVIVRAGKTVDNTVGGIMGLAVNVMDNDNVGRDCALRWAASMEDNVWANPQLHGTLTFLEGNKVKLEAVNSAGGDAVNEHPEWYIPPATSVKEQPAPTPLTYGLSQNYPNPFNPTTTIGYTLAHQEKVSLAIYDLNGRLIQSLVDDVQNAGEHRVAFTASELSSGVYLYRLQAGAQVFTNKMTLIR